MKPKFSPLLLLDFAILDCKYKFTPPTPTDQGVDLRKLMSEYDIDIDFNVKAVGNFYNVYVTIGINYSKEVKIGHSIYAQGIGVFNLSNRDTLNAKQVSDYLYGSCVPMVLTNMRAFIGNLTSNAPMGRYLFPTIDLPELLKRKFPAATKAPAIKK
jgi:preprotein translocase subunit SecB